MCRISVAAPGTKKLAGASVCGFGKTRIVDVCVLRHDEESGEIVLRYARQKTDGAKSAVLLVATPKEGKRKTKVLDFKLIIDQNPKAIQKIIRALSPFATIVGSNSGQLINAIVSNSPGVFRLKDRDKKAEAA